MPITAPIVRLCLAPGLVVGQHVPAKHPIARHPKNAVADRRMSIAMSDIRFSP